MGAWVLISASWYKLSFNESVTLFSRAKLAPRPFAVATTVRVATCFVGVDNAPPGGRGTLAF
jgi:hypothetical protein